MVASFKLDQRVAQATQNSEDCCSYSANFVADMLRALIKGGFDGDVLSIDSHPVEDVTELTISWSGMDFKVEISMSDWVSLTFGEA